MPQLYNLQQNRTQCCIPWCKNLQNDCYAISDEEADKPLFRVYSHGPQEHPIQGLLTGGLTSEYDMHIQYDKHVLLLRSSYMCKWEIPLLKNSRCWVGHSQPVSSAWVQVPALLLIQFPMNVHLRSCDDGSSTCVPVTCVGDSHGTLGSWLYPGYGGHLENEPQYER